jgi:hypothetical protein
MNPISSILKAACPQFMARREHQIRTGTDNLSSFQVYIQFRVSFAVRKDPS